MTSNQIINIIYNSSHLIFLQNGTIWTNSRGWGRDKPHRVLLGYPWIDGWLLSRILFLFYSFSNVTGLEACLTCPERFYCEGAIGDSKKPIPCPKGRYCPAGTGLSQPECPSGTYNPQVSFLQTCLNWSQLGRWLLLKHFQLIFFKDQWK